MRICLTCGELSQASYCEEHIREVRKAQKPKRTTSAHQQGYDSRWRRLSLKARTLQPFCSDCGATEDLQLDHTRETWQRIEDRLPIRLEHTGGVVCGPCNRARGAARTTTGGTGLSTPCGEARPVGQITNLLASNIGLGGDSDGQGRAEGA